MPQYGTGGGTHKKRPAAKVEPGRADISPQNGVNVEMSAPAVSRMVAADDQEETVSAAATLRGSSSQ